MWTRIKNTDRNDRPDTTTYVMDVEIGVVLLLSKDGVDMPPIFIPGVKLSPRADRLIARDGYGSASFDLQSDLDLGG